MRALLQMDGYGMYVWGSYLCVAVILFYQYCAPARQEKKVLRAIAQDIDADADAEFADDAL